MDAFVTRQSRKRKLNGTPSSPTFGTWRGSTKTQATAAAAGDDDESTEVKLALLVSLLDRGDSRSSSSDGKKDIFDDALDQAALLDVLLAHEGNVAAAAEALAQKPLTGTDESRQKGRKRSLAESWGIGAVGQQMSLRALFPGPTTTTTMTTTRVAAPSTSSGARSQRTLFLYDPVDIAAHTPCTLIPNFLPADTAEALLRELLAEAATFGAPHTFKLFDRVVSSPHTSRLYLESADEATAAVEAAAVEATAAATAVAAAAAGMTEEKSTDGGQPQPRAPAFRLTPSVHEGYRYNGSRLRDVRPCPPQLLHVRPLVQEAVHAAVRARGCGSSTSTCTSRERKLRYQPPPDAWRPNAAIVNCYDGPQESVGWHCDQMTYLGPRAVIGSLSLGVAREFRVRRIVPHDDDDNGNDGNDDNDGNNGNSDPPLVDTRQFSIHLPHNSLLVMHAEMQESWKHSVPSAASIEPHPLAGNKRINITYRHYRPEFHPNLTPRCHCGIATVLRVVQRKRKNYGRYFWMCHASNIPSRDGCSFFQWAEFDDDGNPVWASRRNGGTGVVVGGEVSKAESTHHPPQPME